ncbi:hypothetical protein GO013_15565 [Pseudodesulfovibrio sp. JC047]|uniref:head-tail joining protein n=1 Tax=Pseudodesulfovibrio sp. JC047 TaxID=2683199 RepID=UPI0013D5105D|nr:hypothetical protein [Pseudodesulfovibrio sp. JC047]NDV20828.1 hypothetical protein [Pseudodesulfovibrio sp. JC047]
MSFADDIDDMLDPDEFADTADFGNGVEVNGIYDKEPVEIDTGHGFVMSVAHTFTCAQSALPAWVGDGTPVVVDGVSFKVRAPEPDGAGMIELTLEVQ